LRAVVADKVARRWSPRQISRWLRRRWPRRVGWHLSVETIYEAVYRGVVVVTDRQTLRTGRICRHRRGRGRRSPASTTPVATSPETASAVAIRSSLGVIAAGSN